jgi:hypothetical protein
MITTGVTGRPWRASVSPWGAVEPWDGSGVLDWYVAADDRWHVPAREPTIRQRRVEGTAVVETRLRVPRGDVVHRVYSVGDGGGLTVVEVENESSLPIAVAFDRADVRTERPVGHVPVEGIELPAGSFVLPVGHRATARVAIAHDGRSAGPLPALPTHLEVVRGWQALLDRASRFVLPDGDALALAAAQVSGLRCELALGVVPRAVDDPTAYVLSLGELVRLGERPDHWLPELVDAIAAIGPTAGWDVDAALDAAGRVLVVADESRAARDLDRIVARRPGRSTRPSGQPTDIRLVPWLEQHFVRAGALLPDGLPASWHGANFEVYGVPIGAASSVSYAVRWHGERPAVLWETTGDPVPLSAPAIDADWRGVGSTGEALWAAPSVRS